ncbi:ABC transporter permease [Mesorhizobium sp. ANAO-SY3R2]|uniref:ABC transporter permease n=1 Tax=Mesorhizobium sp. ANAO-SY3R2 TaxID=3166644 RepID=UPI00366D94D4
MTPSNPSGFDAEEPFVAAPAPERSWLATVWAVLRANPSMLFGVVVLGAAAFIAVFAGHLGTTDPSFIAPGSRNLVPGAVGELVDNDGKSFVWTYHIGSDNLGRDLYSRVLYGARTSLIVGFVVAALSLVLGMGVGMVAGYFRRLDGIIMRVMDGLMSIPGILLAITLVSLRGASLGTVIVAITVPEVPRVARLVRSLVLSIRVESFIEAAVSTGTPTWKILIRHILPNTMAPLVVQGTFIVASAILAEAALGFLGVGIPAEVPTWGNIISESRTLFRIHPYGIFYSGFFLAFTVLAVNLLGDGLRDALDPKIGGKE